MHDMLSIVGDHLRRNVKRETALWAIFAALTVLFFTFSAVIGNQQVMADALQGIDQVVQ